MVGLRARAAITRRPGFCLAAAMPEVALSSAERVLFPEDGITKGDLFTYYGEIAGAIVPHLKNRPFTMKRYPHGITEDAYFQKQAPRGIPPWIPTRRFTTHPRGGGERLVDFALVNSCDALLWMVQQNCIDMNAWLRSPSLSPTVDYGETLPRTALQTCRARDARDTRSRFAHGSPPPQRRAAWSRARDTDRCTTRLARAAAAICHTSRSDRKPAAISTGDSWT